MEGPTSSGSAPFPPVDSDEFATAFNLVMNSAAGKVELKHRLGDDIPSGAGPHWHLADNPLNRGFVALRERYPDPAEFANFAFRIAAISFAIHRPELERWYRAHPSDPTARLLHPAVIDAAALCRLNKYGELEMDEFLPSIEKIAREKYRNLEK